MKKKDMLPLLGTFVCWGSVYAVFKVVLRTVPPVTVLALRYLVAVPALFLILKLRGTLKPVRREHGATIVAIGLLGYFLSFCLQMLGVNRLTGSVSSLLGAMNPIFIPILASVFLKERLTKEKVGCVLLSMVGVVLIIGIRGTVDVLGAALMLMSVFLWSSASIIIRRLAGAYDPMQIAMMAMIVALPLTGAWAALELQTNACVFSPTAVLGIVYAGLVGTAAAHSLWNYSLSRMDASFCSMFYPLQPLVSSVLGVLILGEQITPNFVLGGIIICVGIVAAVRSGKRA